MQSNLFQEKKATPKIDPQIDPTWKAALQEEFNKPYFAEIKASLKAEKKQGITIYPPGNEIFNAFNLTPFNKVKVVVIGQDPYHGRGQAHGLCFSVQDGVTPPPSLINIYKELQLDINISMPKSGNLTKWAKQGVFLLNAILTVKANQPASHRNIGWETFTDAVIQKLSYENSRLVFLLWGKFAQDKGLLIDSSKHNIFTAAHPSPYSANNGFFGCKHFSKANQVLVDSGITLIDWSI